MTEQIIKCFFKVYNTLGYGFLGKVYENALFIELAAEGWIVEKQKLIEVYYNDMQVGEYYANLAVNDVVILEIKTQEYLVAEHENQLLNCLKATRIEVGLLLNFGKKSELKRKVFDNGLKRVEHS